MRITVILIFLMIIFGCEKEKSSVSVEYRVSNAYSETEITWRTADAAQMKKTILFESVEDEWKQQFRASRGNIVYLSGIYHDTASSVTLQIIVDGKIYKQKTSINEPGKYVTVSGTIPYQESN